MVSSTTSPASDVTIARVHLRSVRLLFLHLFPFLFSRFYLLFASFATSCAAAASSSSFLQFVRVVGLSGRVFASLNLCCILWLLSLLSTVVDSGFEVFDSLSVPLVLLLQFAAAAGVTMRLSLLRKRSKSTYNRARTWWLITTREPDLVKKAWEQ
jgi:hypothetical protein